jgi:hypothetical protein
VAVLMAKALNLTTLTLSAPAVVARVFHFNI